MSRWNTNYIDIFLYSIAIESVYNYSDKSIVGLGEQLFLKGLVICLILSVKVMKEVLRIFQGGRGDKISKTFVLQDRVPLKRAFSQNWGGGTSIVT